MPRYKPHAGRLREAVHRLMECYIVTLEVADDAMRQKAHEKLKTYRWYCPVHQNCWAIVSDQGATQIRDSLTPLLGPKDRLFVVRSGTEAAWWNSYGNKHNEWLQQNL